MAAPSDIPTDFDNPELPPKERERALHRTVRGLLDWAHHAHQRKEIDDKTYQELVAVLEYVRLGKLAWRVAKATFPVFAGLAFLVTKREAVERFITELLK